MKKLILPLILFLAGLGVFIGSIIYMGRNQKNDFVPLLGSSRGAIMAARIAAIEKAKNEGKNTYNFGIDNPVFMGGQSYQGGK